MPRRRKKDKPSTDRPKTQRKKVSRSTIRGKMRALQNWTAKQISRITGHEWGRDTLIVPRVSSQKGEDIYLHPDVRQRFPFSVECKNTEKMPKSLLDWTEQAARQTETVKAETGNNNIFWLVIAKSNDNRPLAVVDAATFFDLMYHLKEENPCKPKRRGK